MTPELASLLDSVPETHEVVTADVAFDADGQSHRGFLARPDDDEVHPGVLLFSDWTGLGDYARIRARMLARLGYVALAGDIYGDGLNPVDPAAEAGRYYGDPALFRARGAANLDVLRGISGVDAKRIAVMGYCFGGSAALELVRSGADVAAAVAFHAGLGTGAPAEPGAVTAKVLVLTGAADPVVPDEAVIAFEDEMRTADVADWQVHSYSGAMHAFTIPGTDAPDHGAQFDARAEARSWVAMRGFLEESLAG